MDDLNIPKHIAIIPDGNRRWAKQNGFPAIEGHRRGVLAMKEISKACRDKGIHTFTAWGFSSENWSRDIEEVKYLMDLFIKVLEDNEKEAHENQIKFVHLGRKDRLPDKLLNVVKRIEHETKDYTKHIYNFCLDYGGQDEIIRATNKILQSDKKYDSITKEEFEQYLDTAGQPHPYVDLLIRTSGEQRTSGLLPFQMAYAELYFEQSYLPDFSVQKFEIALQSYANRDRRFGGNTLDNIKK
jgi:undecaprenyl diphosphate synthase